MHITLSYRLYTSHSIYTELAYAGYIAELARRLHPNILHAHFAYPEGWASYVALRSLGSEIPFLVTLHGYDILIEPRIGYGIRLKRHHDSIARKVLNEAAAIIVASRAVYEETKRLISDHVEKLHLIPMA